MFRTKHIRIISALLVFVMLFSLAACNKTSQQGNPAHPDNTASSAADTANETAGPDLTEPSKATPAPVEFDPADDFQNRFGSLNDCSIWENDEMLLFCPEHDYYYIGYYDKAADVCGVLCGKPECEHDHINKNKDCNGYAEVLPHLGSMNGRICFVAYNYDVSPYYTALYSMNHDGTDRREELRLPDLEVTGSVQQFYLHRGYLYMCALVQNVTAGSPEDYARFSRINVRTGDFEIIYENHETALSYGMRFVGNGIFIYNSTLVNGSGARNRILRFDAATGQIRTMHDNVVQDYFGNTIFRMWVDENENVYYTVGQKENTSAVVYKLDVNGNANPCMDFADDDILYDCAVLSGDIALAIGAPEGGDPRAFWIWVRDLEGNTVFKGEFPQTQFLMELGIEQNYSISDFMGDRNAIYVCFTDADISEEKWNTTPILGVVRYEIVSPTELSGHFVYKSVS